MRRAGVAPPSLPRDSGRVPIATQAAVSRLAVDVNAQPLSGAVLITGERDPDGTLSDGVSFSAGAAKEVAHGLGRRIRGVIEVVPAHLSVTAPGVRAAYADGTDLTTHVRLQAASTGTCWLLVF